MGFVPAAAGPLLLHRSSFFNEAKVKATSLSPNVEHKFSNRGLLPVSASLTA